QHAVGQAAHVGGQCAHGGGVPQFVGSLAAGDAAGVDGVSQGHDPAGPVVEVGVVAGNVLAAVGQAVGVGLAVLQRRFPHFSSLFQHGRVGGGLCDRVILGAGLAVSVECERAVDIVFDLDVRIFGRVVLDEILPVLFGGCLGAGRTEGDAQAGHRCQR